MGSRSRTHPALENAQNKQRTQRDRQTLHDGHDESHAEMFERGEGETEERNADEEAHLFRPTIPRQDRPHCKEKPIASPHQTQRLPAMIYPRLGDGA